MRGFAALAVGACLAAPAARAQEPAAPPPAEGAGPQLDRNQALAAKLAGLVAFVNAACPDLRGETERLHAAVRRLGVEPEALNAGLLQVAASAYQESYGKDVPGNCKRAIETFGSASRLVPDLVVRR